MENKIDYQTLLDFSKGKYSYNDYLKVKHWFLHVRDDKNAEEQLFGQWKEFTHTPVTDTSSLHTIFEKIQYRILLEEKKREKKKSLWHWYRQAAAILIPVIAVSALFYFLSGPEYRHTQSWVELNVPEGARIEFMLPDSTSGWLNSGAKLKYPTAFGVHRKVELTGEAFFNVKHRKHSDFTVSVTDMDIKVLGTEFNVAAYSNETITEVVLKEGKVEIKVKTEGFSRTLQPGDKIGYNRETGSLNMSKVDPGLYTAWKDGYLVIDNEPLGQAIRKIERWYNAEVIIQDDVLKNFRFKATFSDEPLEEVLRFIAMTTPVTYRIVKRDFDSNGVLKKRQVTIRLK
jgi:ferric-dicitrate binding protein FerR (iron transport regulator)